MNRRSFLATTAILGGFAGCTTGDTGDQSKTAGGTATPSQTRSSAPTEAVTNDLTCNDPRRPEPESGSGDVDPVTYPATRPALEENDAMADYIAAYETAYRTNWLLEEYGDELIDVYIGVGDPRFFDTPSGSVIGRLRYTYGFEIGSAIADSPTIYATYYVDESVVVRAEREGYMENENMLQPDPRDGGQVLECFE